MIVLLITLGALAFGVSVGLIELWQQQNERERSTRQWEERERLLDRRKPIAIQREILERRSRRGKQEPDVGGPSPSGDCRVREAASQGRPQRRPGWLR